MLLTHICSIWRAKEKVWASGNQKHYQAWAVKMPTTMQPQGMKICIYLCYHRRGYLDFYTWWNKECKNCLFSSGNSSDPVIKWMDDNVKCGVISYMVFFQNLDILFLGDTVLFWECFGCFFFYVKANAGFVICWIRRRRHYIIWSRAWLYIWNKINTNFSNFKLAMKSVVCLKLLYGVYFWCRWGSWSYYIHVFLLTYFLCFFSLITSHKELFDV